MHYVPQIAGLPGGSGHAGWLISAGRGLLNLWEASPSGGRSGEPALLCMHSQGTTFTSVCLDADRGSQMLLGASVESSGAECVTASSLDVESLLAPKARFPMPHNGTRAPGRNCLAVASLHSFGGPLAETCVGSYGGALVVWRVGSANKPGASSGVPTAVWKAHDALVTSLLKSPFGLTLFSGAADGKVHVWNMREKPNRPAQQFVHQGRIAALSQINDQQLLTAAGNGQLMVWDLRNASAPVKFSVPDGKPIVRAVLSPFADSAAVATTAGIYSVDLLDEACSSSRIVPSLRSPVTALVYNAATSEVVAAGGPGAPGSISVFRPQLGGY
ncbi:WD40 repeat [Micractinium conductrix]|uniref:WD40 repeat n=1 Tax=Micractinium conductrix TaxID=554055 RepID=A0A2P6VHC5_9CHLO|nr:WD40 repeat [Micractinium conductrix]|eukprot:PSC73489.1 WD40 repeat [Micractinium conductrix]